MSICYKNYGCTGLTTINFPHSVTNIGCEAFSGCTGLTEIIIPHSVTNIGCEAFSYCYDLGAINIPDSVTYIGYCAFYNCLSLTEITCNAEVPPVCGYEVFYDIPSSATLYVPDSSIEEYKETSPWNNFANIVAMSEKEDDGIVKMVERKKEDSCYDLQGREIVHPQKGIFIKNGKKVVAP